MRGLVACALVLACGRVELDPAPPDAFADLGCATTRIDPGALSSDGGFAWYMSFPVGTAGLADTNADLFQSTLRLFEDARELGPAHAFHVDIRAIGLGRFSHWTDTDGSEDSIRFAASDNSDPRTNGRAYAYCPSVAVRSLLDGANNRSSTAARGRPEARSSRHIGCFELRACFEPSFCPCSP